MPRAEEYKLQATVWGADKPSGSLKIEDHLAFVKLDDRVLVFAARWLDVAEFPMLELTGDDEPEGKE